MLLGVVAARMRPRLCPCESRDTQYPPPRQRLLGPGSRSRSQACADCVNLSACSLARDDSSRAAEVDKVNRRKFVALLGAAACSSPVSAQEAGRSYRIGCLFPPGRQAPPTLALFDELRLNGFVEGQNLAIVAGSFGAEAQPLAERASALVKAAPDVIVAGGHTNLLAVQEATQTLPIVGVSNDMVGEGLVQSLARPGRNTTGVSILSPELDGKRQDLLLELAPHAHRVAALADPLISTPQQLQLLKQAASAHGVELSTFTAAKADEILPAMEQAKESGAEGLNVLGTPLFFANASRIILRSTGLRLPTMYQWPEMAEDGGL